MCEQSVNPPEADECCVECGRHIGTGIRCRACHYDAARLEYYEEN